MCGCCLPANFSEEADQEVAFVLVLPFPVCQAVVSVVVFLGFGECALGKDGQSEDSGLIGVLLRPLTRPD